MKPVGLPCGGPPYIFCVVSSGVLLAELTIGANDQPMRAALEFFFWLEHHPSYWFLFGLPEDPYWDVNILTAKLSEIFRLLHYRGTKLYYGSEPLVVIGALPRIDHSITDCQTIDLHHDLVPVITWQGCSNFHEEHKAVWRLISQIAHVHDGVNSIEPPTSQIVTEDVLCDFWPGSMKYTSRPQPQGFANVRNVLLEGTPYNRGRWTLCRGDFAMDLLDVAMAAVKRKYICTNRDERYTRLASTKPPQYILEYTLKCWKQLAEKGFEFFEPESGNEGFFNRVFVNAVLDSEPDAIVEFVARYEETERKLTTEERHETILYCKKWSYDCIGAQ